MYLKLPTPGTLLNNGRYRIVKELNTGGTAIVYEAYDSKKNRKCALKVMNLSVRQFEVAMKLSRREVVFSSSIHHENFVRLLDVFSEGQHLILVWELVSGLDLLDLLNQAGGKMSENMAAYYYNQLLQGVLFMHDNGFCHRDLKAENCMIVKSTQKLKIIDFGLARQLESAVTSTTGTPDYLAPELLCTSRSDRDKIDQRAVDVWATGVILYLLVTGTYPFEDPEDPNCFVQVFKNISNCNVRPLPDHVSEGCRKLLDFIFQVDPKRRIQLKELSENEWLRNTSKTYADEIQATLPSLESANVPPLLSIKNLIQRFPMHKKLSSTEGLSSPEGEAVPLSKSNRGISIDHNNSNGIAQENLAYYGPLSERGLMENSLRTYQESDADDQATASCKCGFRGVLSRFCFSIPSDDPEYKNSLEKKSRDKERRRPLSQC